MQLAYLYSRYPVLSQTFCDMEMLELERRGYDLLIGSVHAPLTSLTTRTFREISVASCLRAACSNSSFVGKENPRCGTLARGVSRPA